MSEIRFEMRPVEKKRKKLSIRGSKYDPMIDQFVAGEEELVEIIVEDRKASYVAGQLNKRIALRELGNEMEASAAQDFVYLEKKHTE